MAAVSAWQAVLWAIAGTLGVELLECGGAMLRSKGRPWWRRGGPSALAVLASVLIRLLLSAGLAGPAAAAGHITTAVGALAIGVGAPLLLEQILRLIPMPPRGAGNEH